MSSDSCNERKIIELVHKHSEFLQVAKTNAFVGVHERRMRMYPVHALCAFVRQQLFLPACRAIRVRLRFQRVRACREQVSNRQKRVSRCSTEIVHDKSSLAQALKLGDRRVEATIAVRSAQHFERRTV